MRWLGVSLITLIVLAGVSTPAWATQPGKCTLLTEVAETTSGTTTLLYSSPARVCRVDILLTGNGGWAQIYDESTAKTDSTRTVMEPGSASSGDHDFVDYGEYGYVTEFGLGVITYNAKVIVKWGR